MMECDTSAQCKYKVDPTPWMLRLHSTYAFTHLATIRLFDFNN